MQWQNLLPYHFPESTTIEILHALYLSLLLLPWRQNQRASSVL